MVTCAGRLNLSFHTTKVKYMTKIASIYLVAFRADAQMRRIYFFVIY
jgi:hypothetical protein